MPEAKAAGNIGFSDQVETQQLVQGIECRRPERCGCSGKLWVERVAGDCRPLKHGPRTVLEECELFGQSGRNERRHIQISGEIVATASGGRSRQRRASCSR